MTQPENGPGQYFVLIYNSRRLRKCHYGILLRRRLRCGRHHCCCYHQWHQCTRDPNPNNYFQGIHPRNESCIAVSSFHRNSTCLKHLERHFSKSSHSIGLSTILWSDSTPRTVFSTRYIHRRYGLSFPTHMPNTIEHSFLLQGIPDVTTRHEPSSVQSVGVSKTWLIQSGQDDRLHVSH